MAKSVSDIRKVWQTCEGYDASDRYAKETPPVSYHVNSLGVKNTAFSFGVPPPEALAVCTVTFRGLFNEAIQTLQKMGGQLIELDWTPFDKAGKLLYDGTFVSERLASLPDGWFETNQSLLHPVIREIFGNVVKRQSTAVEAYRDLQAKAL